MYVEVSNITHFHCFARTIIFMRIIVLINNNRVLDLYKFNIFVCDLPRIPTSSLIQTTKHICYSENILNLDLTQLYKINLHHQYLIQYSHDNCQFVHPHTIYVYLPCLDSHSIWSSRQGAIFYMYLFNYSIFSTFSKASDTRFNNFR